MSAVLKSLKPGERIVYSAQVHSIVLLPGMVFFVLSRFFPSDFISFGQQLDGFISILFLFLAVVAFLRGAVALMMSEFVVTDKRVIFRTGLFMQENAYILRANVEGVRVQRDFLGLVFGFGRVRVDGTGGKSLSTYNISKPQEFSDAVNQ